jgi:hypothetical protein
MYTQFASACLILTLGFTACKRDTPDDPKPTLGGRTAVGANVWFRCKVGGVPYTATHLQAFQTNGGGASTTLWRYTLVGDINGSRPFNLQVQNLQGTRVGASTHALSTASSTTPASIQYNDGQNTWQTVSGSAAGTWTIATVAGSRTTGSFSFVLRGITAGDSILVTDGEYATDQYGEI